MEKLIILVVMFERKLWFWSIRDNLPWVSCPRIFDTWSEGAEVQHTDLGLKFNLLYHLSNNCPVWWLLKLNPSPRLDLMLLFVSLRKLAAGQTYLCRSVVNWFEVTDMDKMHLQLNSRGNYEHTTARMTLIKKYKCYLSLT